MIYHLSSQLAQTDCLVIGILEDESLTPELSQLDKSLNGLLSRLIKKLQKPGQFCYQSDLEASTLNIGAIILISCGKKDKYTAEVLENHLKASVKAVLAQNCAKATLHFPLLSNITPDQQLEFILRVVDCSLYIQPQFKTTSNKQALQEIFIHEASATPKALCEAIIIAEAIQFTRNLADLPANHCTPSYLSKSCVELAKSVPNVSYKILHKEEIQTLGMGGLLAVSQGSVEPPCFIELKYQGLETKGDPIVLIGKGVTFDAGGISIKPAANINEMKFDMAGAATVLGAIFACAKLKLPINLIALVPATENLTSGTAVKPGDVITMMSKQTVEVLNTDAEGRLILADALCYAEQFKPKYVIDIATLTGAVIVALGNVASGIMANDEALANALLEAAQKSLDKAWRLPLFPEYREKLDSPNADLINANFDRSAGSIIGGIFLERFVKDYRWAHIDIAGTAWISGNNRVATGRPLPLLLEFLRNAK